MRYATLFMALAVALIACTSRSPESETGNGGLTLPFIDDDYAAALAEAQERDLPLFVETWAPW